MGPEQNRQAAGGIEGRGAGGELGDLLSPSPNCDARPACGLLTARPGPRVTAPALTTARLRRRPRADQTPGKPHCGTRSHAPGRPTRWSLLSAVWADGWGHVGEHFWTIFARSGLTGAWRIGAGIRPIGSDQRGI